MSRKTNNLKKRLAVVTAQRDRRGREISRLQVKVFGLRQIIENFERLQRCDAFLGRRPGVDEQKYAAQIMVSTHLIRAVRDARGLTQREDSWDVAQGLVSHLAGYFAKAIRDGEI